MKSEIKELNKSALVMRLERNQSDLLKMKSTLRSYIYEPRTPSLFERRESLKHKLENFSSTNGKVLQSLKRHKEGIQVHVELAEQQLQEFHLLRQGVEEYVSGARNH